MIDQKLIGRIAEETRASEEHVAAAIQLFDADATVPFVARYRRDVTGNLPEQVLERIQERNKYYKELSSSRADILNNIEKQGTGSEMLRENLEAIHSKSTLQDLYATFKKPKRTKANVAREKGLEPLASFLWEQVEDEREILDFTNTFIDSSKGVSTPEEALDGANNIMAEWLCFDVRVRRAIADRMREEGVLKTSLTRNAAGDRRFEAFAQFSEPLKSVNSGRLLTLLRGERQQMVHRELHFDDTAAEADILAIFLKRTGSPYEPLLRFAVETAYRSFLRLSVEIEVMEEAREKADEDILRGLRQQLEAMLLAAPAGAIAVMGVEPQRAGCRLAAVDSAGAYLGSASIPAGGEGENLAEAKATLLNLVTAYGVAGVAVAKTGPFREVERFIAEVLREAGHKSVFTFLVPDAGAAAYAASKIGRDEYPALDMTTRSVVSIARRLQDPLAELVKIEPKQITLGPHQYDIAPKRLREGLFRTFESAVNRVGVDVNTASVELLRYVAGLTMGHAQNIVAFREEHGKIASRAQLNEVPGIGPSKFEQCVGFMRVRDGEQPLDNTGIHPEAYPVVEKIAADSGMPLAELLGNRNKLREMDLAPHAEGHVGEYTLKDIRFEMMRPGRDVRGPFKLPRFLEGVNNVADLKEGMVCDGIVTNITEFGAFVDIGVKQDGLVHLSELANHFVRDPRRVVKPGDVVPVKVIKIDQETRRVSLSMKALMGEKPVRGGGRRPEPPAAEGSPPTEGARGDRGERGGSRERGPRQDRSLRDAARSSDNRVDGRRDGGGRGRGRAGGRREGGQAMASRLGTPSAVKHADSRDGLNTTLADQLALLKDKLGQ